MSTIMDSIGERYPHPANTGWVRRDSGKRGQ